LIRQGAVVAALFLILLTALALAETRTLKTAGGG
jgi:hypothetical protein